MTSKNKEPKEDNPANPIYADTSKIGETVKIKHIDKNTCNMEDYFYLKKYENKKGSIIACNTSTSGISTYQISFDQENIGYFYREDFTIITEAD